MFPLTEGWTDLTSLLQGSTGQTGLQSGAKKIIILGQSEIKKKKTDLCCDIKGWKVTCIWSCWTPDLLPDFDIWITYDVMVPLPLLQQSILAFHLVTLAYLWVFNCHLKIFCTLHCNVALNLILQGKFEAKSILICSAMFNLP